MAERSTGEVRQAQIFVATLWASNYTYAEAVWTQALPDWIAARTFVPLSTLERCRRGWCPIICAAPSPDRAAMSRNQTLPTRRLPTSTTPQSFRLALFERLDRPAMRPLPAARYEPAEWNKLRLNIDYHFEVEDQLFGRSIERGNQLLHQQSVNGNCSPPRCSNRRHVSGAVKLGSVDEEC